MQAAILAAAAQLAAPRPSAEPSRARVNQAWRKATRHIVPRMEEDGQWDEYVRDGEAVAACEILAEVGLSEQLFEWYINELRRAFGQIGAQVGAYLDYFEGVDDARKPEIVTDLLQFLGTCIHRWQQPLAALFPSHKALDSYRDTFLNTLYSTLPPRFSSALSIYLLSLLRASSPEFPVDPSRPLVLPTLMTLLNRYDPLLFSLIYDEIEQKVRRDAERVWDRPVLRGLVEWLNEEVMAWVGGVYEKSMEGGREEARKFLKPTFARFEYHVHKVLGQLRTMELFEIIAAYPQSKAALEDLKMCLYKTDQRTLLVNRLRDQLSSLLLHPGSTTKQIILVYISTIRALRIIDPQGVLLSRVAEPIRSYLRARDDTIRCIVLSLIEEGNELVRELAASEARPVQDARDEAENFNDTQWTPDPIDAPPDFRKSKSADVIQLLVSIYPTKDLFIKELQVLLAQRLLALKDYDALQREVDNVRILKLRFGEQNLHGCEVMISDLKDSREVDTAVRTARGDGVVYAGPRRDEMSGLRATIVSRLFWPAFQVQGLRLPGQLGKMRDEYNKAYAQVKPDKKLRWIPQLGTVNLTLELKDRRIQAECTPLQASIIELFSAQESWTTDDLAIELVVTDSGLVRNGLYFWNNLGVLKALPGDEWLLLEEKDEKTEAATAHVIEAAAEAVQSVEAQQVDQMRVYWQFVKGMLSNLGSAPSSKIHSTLSMLVPGYKGKTVDELTAFMEAMLAEGLVTRTEKGAWKIVR